MIENTVIMDKAEYLKIRSFSVFEAMNSRDFTNFEFLLDENAVFDSPVTGKIEGQSRIILFLKALLKKYRKLEFTILDIITDSREDKSCVIWNNEGEQLNGNPYNNRGNTIIRLQDDKIVYISDFFKDTSFVNTQ